MGSLREVRAVDVYGIGVQCSSVEWGPDIAVIDAVRWVDGIKACSLPKLGDVLVACSVAEVAGLIHIQPQSVHRNLFQKGSNLMRRVIILLPFCINSATP